MASKRFYSACCFMIIFSICYNVFLLKKAKNDPTTEATFSCKEAVGMCSTSTAAAGHLTPCIDSSGFYTANCWLKSFRKMWLTSVKSRNPRVKDRQRFVTPCGFIQSLFLLICFAWCTVVSGIMIAILSLSQMDVSKAWPLLTLGLLAKLVLMPERDDHNSCIAEPPSNSKQCATSPTKVYIHQSVSIHLDVILATISMLLLRSGDVEVNPGPRDRETDSNQPANEPQPGFSESDLALNSKEMSASSDMGCLSLQKELRYTTPSVPQQPDAKDDNATDLRELELIGSFKSLLLHEDGDKWMDIGTKMVFSEDELKTINTRPFLATFEKQQEDDLVCSTEEIKSEPPLYCTVKLNADYIQKPANHFVQTRQEMPDYCDIEDQITKEDFTEQVNKELDSLKGLQDSFAKDTLDDCTMMFFCHANRLYRAGFRCDYCSICGRRKQNVASTDNPGGEYDSHVFPKGMLTVFRRIHCYNSSGVSDSAGQKQSDSVQNERYREFIYDFMSDRRMGASAWTYQLLCGDCEQKCSPAEQKIRHVYVNLMGLDEFESLKFLNEDYWFNYILVIIMFRGLLVSEKLSNCFNDPLFKAKFTELWNYCKFGPRALEGVTKPDLRLFLLPNRPNRSITTEKAVFLYSFDYILHCPMFTRLVTSSENGSFFYWKFDCFHVVFALDDISRQYFNHFQNILHVLENDEKHLILRWTNWHDSSTVTKSKASKAIQIKYKSNKTPQLFPPALLQENAHFGGEVTKRIFLLACVADHEPKLLASCKVMTEQHKGLGRQCPNLDISVPWEPSSVPPTGIKTVTVGFRSEQHNDNSCIEKAAQRSLLRLPERLIELESKNKLQEAIADAIKTEKVKNIVDMESRINEAENKNLEDNKRYAEKQKKAGKVIKNLSSSLTRYEKELKDAKTKAAEKSQRADRESQRADRESQRAEEEMKRADIAEMRRKESIQCRDMLISLLAKEIRILNSQQKEGCAKPSHHHSMYRMGKTTLNNCMESMKNKGVHLFRQYSLSSSDAFNSKSESMEDFRSVEYLDLSTAGYKVTLKQLVQVLIVHSHVKYVFLL